MDREGTRSGDYRAETLDRLRYRRQFLLAPRPVAIRPGWRSVDVGAEARLQAHPDLALTRAAGGDRSITLLGDLLDPGRPEATNADLLDLLLGKLEGAGELHRWTDRLAGRWVLLVDDGRERVLFQDACGLRQVCHGRVPSGATACASQPGLLAGVLGLTPDPEALDFMATRGESDRYVYWMPGDTTIYRELHALLPNHQLVLDSGEVRRFGPGPLPPSRPGGDVIEEAASLLRGTIDAAQRRGPLALPMTAGWDSRLMLASARDFAPRLFAYTLSYPDQPARHPDVAVPRRLLARLRLQHHLIPYPRAVQAAFKAVQRASTTAVKGAYCADAQAMYQAYPPDRLCVTGDAAEVFKCHFRLPGRGPADVTPADLCALTLLAEHPFADRAFAAWLDGAARQPLALLDLFAWEQMAGRWQAQIRAEYDIVQESLAPLGTRAMLLLMLSVDEAQRRPPAFPVLRALLERLWGEVLAEPINPPGPLRLRTAVGGLLRRFGLRRPATGAPRRRPTAPPTSDGGGSQP